MSTAEKIKEKFGAAVEILEHNPRRHYVLVRASGLKEVARFVFKDLGGRLCTATAVDTRAGFVVLYHMAIDLEGVVFTLKTLAPRDNPELDSLCDFLPGAQWIELEINELMGVNFKGNPRSRHFLLADDFPEGVFPLRKTEIPGGAG